MKYVKFIIENYKGIINPIEINVEKNSLIPIIGINECGKTTILNAIYAFDYFNDSQNKIFFHLNDILNLYKLSNGMCKISAVINVTKGELKKELMKGLQITDANADDKLKIFDDKEPFEITVTRILEFKNNEFSSLYQFSPKIRFKYVGNEDAFCKRILQTLPYILYFDDFRETFPDEIEIDEENKDIGWLPILQELFFLTNENFSVFELKNIEERRRKSILSQIKKKLNDALTSQWANFRLENKDVLEMDIDFKTEKKVVQVEIETTDTTGKIIRNKVDKEIEKHFLKFDVIERDSEGNEHYFYVKNRSKGFYWFFNFVMKLEFNPDKAGDLNNAIYLLDEPGSYLHPYAQSKLCKKLKELSQENIVIYCTHSHYLLNPKIIPLNKIHIANKNDMGDIELQSFYQFKNPKNKNLSTAFQTINDALYIKPFDLDINNKKILIVEGIIDYYAFTMFKNDENIGILPGKGADSLTSFISLMIAQDIDFRVLWDNDVQGIANFEKAKKFFGDEFANKCFYILPTIKGKKKILQDLFEPVDLKFISDEFKLAKDISFDKKITTLFFSDMLTEILAKISQQTKDNFSEVFTKIKIKG